MSSKAPSVKSKAHLLPTIHLPPAMFSIVLVGTPRARALLLHCLLPLGREVPFGTNPSRAGRHSTGGLQATRGEQGIQGIAPHRTEGCGKEEMLLLIACPRLSL